MKRNMKRFLDYNIQKESTLHLIISTVSVTGVSLNPSTAQTIDVDGKVSFTATVTPDNASDKTVKWDVDGTDEVAVTLYSDENCTSAIQ